MAPLSLQTLLEQFLAASPQVPAAMYRTTAKHLARMLGYENLAEVILTSTARELPTRLELYLRTHAQASSSKVRNNKTQAKTLIEWGIAQGLIATTRTPSPAWKAMWAQKQPIYRGSHIGRRFMDYCVDQGIEPHDVTAAHFHTWREEYFAEATQTQPAEVVRNYTSQTRVMLKTNAASFPRLVIADLAIAHPISITVRQWPLSLQHRWHQLEDWLLRLKVLGRGRPWKPDSVVRVRRRLEELYGFLISQGEPVPQLESMFSPAFLERFLTYKYEERNNAARSILSYVVYFRKVMAFFDLPTQSLEEFLAELPVEDLQVRPIPRHTIPSYALLEQLPTHLDREIAALSDQLADPAIENRDWKQVRLALLWRLKVVFLFLLRLSWRMGNLSQLRWGTSRDLARYQAPTCRLLHGLLYQDTSKRWRFFFPRSATKNGRVVQGELPVDIVPVLEHYLHTHWLQLRARDRSWLFPNSAGNLNGTSEWCNIVKRVTFQLLGVAVNPHKFRHAFAFYFLTQRPEDYLTLSRYLWHRSVEVTTRIYGGFEPEDALRYIEAWRTQQADRPESPSRLPPPNQAQGAPPVSPRRPLPLRRPQHRK